MILTPKILSPGCHLNPAQWSRAGWLVLLAAFSILEPGCGQRQLIQTPNLFLDRRFDPFIACPAEARNNRVEILYATDRLPVERKGGGQEYGYLRSRSLAFGRCVVEIGENLPWPVVEENSRLAKRNVSMPLTVQSIREIGRFPDTPFPFIRRGEAFEDDPAVAARNEQASQAFRSEVSRRLSGTACKEAFVFVHGYNNTFEDSVYVMADLWHFLGRKGLPVVYSWPAGRGSLRGYNYDRESGEFTFLHLKQFIQLLASCPDIEKIHFLAHSRGTDVLTSALREVILEARSAGENPEEAIKISDLTLAAPDFDIEVFTQRMLGDRLGYEVGEMTIYVSEEDRALGLSTWLFRGIKRVGKVTFGELPPDLKRRLGQNSSAAMIDARGSPGFVGHSYFYSDPAVSSDLILLMGYGRKPGAENGRPLIPVGPNFWRIEKGYPLSRN